jgi:hypothetical protein
MIAIHFARFGAQKCQGYVPQNGFNYSRGHGAIQVAGESAREIILELGSP